MKIFLLAALHLHGLSRFVRRWARQVRATGRHPEGATGSRATPASGTFLGWFLTAQLVWHCLLGGLIISANHAVPAATRFGRTRSLADTPTAIPPRVKSRSRLHSAPYLEGGGEEPSKSQKHYIPGPGALHIPSEQQSTQRGVPPSVQNSKSQPVLARCRFPPPMFHQTLLLSKRSLGRTTIGRP